METFRDHIERAISIVGSQQKLAEKIDLSQQGISFLLNDAKNIKAEIALKIERATGGEVTRAELRPDIFGDAA